MNISSECLRNQLTLIEIDETNELQMNWKWIIKWIEIKNFIKITYFDRQNRLKSFCQDFIWFRAARLEFFDSLNGPQLIMFGSNKYIFIKYYMLENNNFNSNLFSRITVSLIYEINVSVIFYIYYPLPCSKTIEIATA